MSPVPFPRSTSDQCRWFVADLPSQPSSKRAQPVTGPRICGEPVKPGSSYCECHYARELPARKVTLTNRSAYFAGQRAGDAVQLAHGVSTKGDPLLIGRG